ncbi:hypothetical protein CHARACLAT_026617 [Characodon lateralis]|uniref:Secreted protein n=1 Tax=Characodon lateralis TaxID=208331 RepID=A0ABU7CRI2_9TELE|nr:hypothetical protein [Characodon lateralis]
MKLLFNFSLYLLLASLMVLFLACLYKACHFPLACLRQRGPAPLGFVPLCPVPVVFPLTTEAPPPAISVVRCAAINVTL